MLNPLHLLFTAFASGEDDAGDPRSWVKWMLVIGVIGLWPLQWITGYVFGGGMAEDHRQVLVGLADADPELDARAAIKRDALWFWVADTPRGRIALGVGRLDTEHAQGSQLVPDLEGAEHNELEGKARAYAERYNVLIFAERERRKGATPATR